MNNVDQMINPARKTNGVLLCIMPNCQSLRTPLPTHSLCFIPLFSSALFSVCLWILSLLIGFAKEKAKSREQTDPGWRLSIDRGIVKKEVFIN